MSRRVISNSIRAINLAFCLGAALPPIAQAAPITGQSPIDIVTSDAVYTSLPPLQFDYSTDANVTITPIDLGGEDGTIRGAVTPGTGPTDGGEVTVGGVEYVLQQFHFHTPSEHLINGQQFPMELHLISDQAKARQDAARIASRQVAITRWLDSALIPIRSHFNSKHYRFLA